MKKVTLLITFIIFNFTVFSQAPEKMSYQAVIRDGNDILITNTTIGIQIRIIQGTISGSSVYNEMHTTNTNTNGLVTLEIGGGTPTFSNFANINWGAGPYFIEIGTDPTGGTNYSLLGTSQLLSVPYALYAESSGGAAVVCPEDSLGICSELTDPLVPPTTVGSGTPGIVDNRYYRYTYLLKKNDTRTKLSPESAVTHIIDNTIEGQIDFSVMIPDEFDIDSIVVYRQFSVDNIVFGLYSLVESFPVTPNQLFSFTDNYDNFSIISNPQPLTDTNTTHIKGLIKTDLLTEDRVYQLPDASGTIALVETLPEIMSDQSIVLSNSTLVTQIGAVPPTTVVFNSSISNINIPNFTPITGNSQFVTVNDAGLYLIQMDLIGSFDFNSNSGVDASVVLNIPAGSFECGSTGSFSIISTGTTSLTGQSIGLFYLKQGQLSITVSTGSNGSGGDGVTLNSAELKVSLYDL
ncbi:MAG: hypothetical protein QNK23_06020 [Crocinitomicaceae bacterium]|nr:hypothetical protein [Crocinitomicaceae bacterium]